ncbi:VanZ family protein [Paraferrimonas sp. SM1919]|uniref:VanZ family protein n=1 Tax=Paraferrimonas sp. SM1919 TaxID=2662263 RepID=UPI0013D3FC10|nr:VanZ family protein [Paraferrimonas sp. SM1919]
MISLIFIKFEPKVTIPTKYIQFALIFAFIAISYLVFSKPSYPKVDIDHFDKIGHFSAFFALALLTANSFPKLSNFGVLLIMASYACLIEFVQYFLPYRSAEWADFAADMAGAMTYMILHYFISPNKHG